MFSVPLLSDTCTHAFIFRGLFWYDCVLLRQFLQIGRRMVLIVLSTQILFIHFLWIHPMFLQTIPLAVIENIFTFQENGEVCFTYIFVFYSYNIFFFIDISSLFNICQLTYSYWCISHLFWLLSQAILFGQFWTFDILLYLPCTTKEKKRGKRWNGRCAKHILVNWTIHMFFPIEVKMREGY